MLHSFRMSKGVTLMERPEDLLRPIPLGNVVVHNLLRSARRRAAIDTHVSDYFWHRRMMNGFQMRTICAEVEKLRFKRSFISSGPNLILNGASGGRARNFIRKQLDFSEESVEFFRNFHGERLNPSEVGICVSSARTLVIHAKNYHNFFHFVAESLHQALASLPEGVEIEAIEIVARSKQPAREFIELWVDQIRELLGAGIRVSVREDLASRGNEPVLMAFSAEHLLYQFTGDHIQLIEKARPPGWTWTGYDATPHPVKILQLNSYDGTLVDFRIRLIELAQKKVRKRWARKIYVRRSRDLARPRFMMGEDTLVTSLTTHGFEVVEFETMSPLEQVKCVHDATCIVMQHGAGMTNMLFAKATAHVFELGTYQTMMARWGDFMPLSHVAGCHYHHITLEMDFPHEDKDPVFAEDGLLPPSLSAGDIEDVVSLVNEERKQALPGGLVGLIRHCDYLIGREAFNQAYRLLDANMNFFSEHQHFWETRGRLAEKCGHVERARDCYERAPDLRSARAGLKRLTVN